MSEEQTSLTETQKQFYDGYITNVTNFHKCFKELNENNKKSQLIIENLKKENFELKNQLVERDASVSFLQDQTEKCINDFAHLKNSYEAEIQNSKSLSAKNNELELKNIDLLKQLQVKNCEIEELNQMKTKFKEFVQFFSEKEKATTETTNNRSPSTDIEQQPSITTALENPLATPNPLINELKREPLQSEQLYSPISLDTVAASVVENSSELTPAPSNTSVEIKAEKIVPSITSIEIDIGVDDDNDEIIYINSVNVNREKSSQKRKSTNNENDIELKKRKFSLFSIEKDYFQAVSYFKSSYYSKLAHNGQFKLNEAKKTYKINLPTRKNNLSFSFNEECFDLKPFDVLQMNNKLDCIILNVGSEITALDWCIDNPNSSDNAHSKNVQYFAFACKDLAFAINSNGMKLKGCKSKNIIFIGKIAGSESKPNESKLEVFGIFDKKIDTVNCLKWGVFNKNNSIGYLLAASSNGNGYVYLVEDLLSKPSDPSDEHKKVFSINGIDCYEPKHKITLKKNANKCHQCVSCDWNQNNGATVVALGYSDGSINIYDVIDDKVIINASQVKSASSIDILKWCKTNNSPKHFYSLSFKEKVFSKKSNSNLMTIRGCNSKCTKSKYFNIEGQLEDFDLSIDNNLIACSQKDLCGKSHIVTLELSAIRSKSAVLSSFSTYESINSISLSDYLDKILVTVADGSIILSNRHRNWESNDNNSAYARILKFSKEKDLKKDLLIKIENNVIFDEDQWTESKSSNDDDNGGILLNKVKWNPNAKFSNWFMCAGSPGFLFINKINDIQLD